jgi:hypothetical protein
MSRPPAYLAGVLILLEPAHETTLRKHRSSAFGTSGATSSPRCRSTYGILTARFVESTTLPVTIDFDAVKPADSQSVVP